jgi:hypothetical protein
MNRHLIASAVMLAGMTPAGIVAQMRSGELLVTVDHLVYATPELSAGVERIEKLLGVKASPGGQHPGRGTRNALLALGPTSYLEIIGPDPEQPTPALPRPFGIDDLKEPRLVAWAAKSMDLARLASEAGRNGVKLGEVISGSRRRADGVMLSWRYTDPRTIVAGGALFRSSSTGGRRHIRRAPRPRGRYSSRCAPNTRRRAASRPP